MTAHQPGSSLTIDELVERNKSAFYPETVVPFTDSNSQGICLDGPQGPTDSPSKVHRLIFQRSPYDHQYFPQFTPPITFSSRILVACVDSRSNPYTVFNFSSGEALVLRNPGGRVWSALPDIVALDSRFDISQLVLLQHSDCGTSHVTEAMVDERIATSVKPDNAESRRMRDDVVKYKLDHGEEGVREDLALLRAQPFLRKELAEGAVGLWLDTFGGLMKKISLKKSVM